MGSHPLWFTFELSLNPVLKKSKVSWMAGSISSL